MQAFKCSCPRVTRPSAGRAVPVHASAGGFGKTNKKAVVSTPDSGSYVTRTKRRVNVEDEPNKSKQDAKPVSGSDPALDMTKGNWFNLAALSDFAGEKKTKIKELVNKQAVIINMHKDQLYCYNAYSTAYQYPLIDGKITDEPQGPIIEVPLDGTVYDLKTGKVIKWCPKDGNPVRSLLGALKKDVPPVPLPVYPVVVKTDGAVWVKLS